jgi:transcriptional regulator with XRE-family HTH domain
VIQNPRDSFQIGAGMQTPGQRLRELRERLGLTGRDVESVSTLISARTGNSEYTVSSSRLSDIEMKGSLPTIYRMYSLSVIYRKPMDELMQYFGIEQEGWIEDTKRVAVPRTHVLSKVPPKTRVRTPVDFDPGFHIKKTTNIGRMVQRWAELPPSFIEGLSDGSFTYGYVGTEDFTMYPLLLPGSFVKVDENRSTVEERQWKSEYERPIYLIESRDGYVVSWCSVKGNVLIVQPHPLSPSGIRIFRHPQEAEVIGQVVAIAMSLDMDAKGHRLCD